MDEDSQEKDPKNSSQQRRVERAHLKSKIKELESRLVGAQAELKQKDCEIADLKEELDRPLSILSVEDSAADQRLLQEVFRAFSKRCELHFASDGIEALQFLMSRGDSNLRPLPDLILLDLNLPVKDGEEVLKEIRGNEKLRHIPVLIVTTATPNVLSRYEGLADDFFTKPADVSEYAHLLERIERLSQRSLQVN